MKFLTLFILVLAVPFTSSTNDYSTSAVLFVDIQGLWTKNSIAGDFPDLGTNLKKLVGFARDNDVLVVHIYADYNERDTKWFKLPRDIAVTYYNNPPDHDIMQPIAGEAVFNKSTFDGFYNTSLHEYLQSKGIDTVYAAGVATSVCVLNTAHGAFIRGYETFFVKNACGDDSQTLHDLVIQRYFRNLVVNIEDDGLVLDTSDKREEDVVLDEDTSLLTPDETVQTSSEPLSAIASSTKQDNSAATATILAVIAIVMNVVLGVVICLLIYRRKQEDNCSLNSKTNNPNLNVVHYDALTK